MAKFRDRKKRVALAMGLASLLGASKMTSAAGNKAGKAIGITMGGLGAVGILYETLADTWGRDKKMPSALKAFGVIKSKEDGQIPINPELQKKINDELKNQDKKGEDENEGKNKNNGQRSDDFEIIEGEQENINKGKGANESFVIIGNNDEINSNVKNDGAKFGENFGMLKSALDGNEKNYGLDTVVIGNGDAKSAANITLKSLATRLGLKRDEYRDNGRNQFLIDVAKKIGLQGVQYDAMLGICSHNYADVSKTVNSRNDLTKEQKDRLLALCRLRNMIAYDCGAGAASNWNLMADKGEGRPNGLPVAFFEQ